MSNDELLEKIAIAIAPVVLKQAYDMKIGGNNDELGIYVERQIALLARDILGGINSIKKDSSGSGLTKK